MTQAAPRTASRLSAFGPHTAIFAFVLIVDQLTKYWARLRFSLPGGAPNYELSMPVIGEWLQFRLVYNLGAAFGMRPQNALPFLHPTVFYTVFSAVAIVFLAVYYRKLGAGERTARLGVLLILAGAFGNLIDRVAMHKVTDFIDAGIPGFYPRWPVFNIADSSVCIGIALLLISSLFTRRPAPAETAPQASAETPAAE